MSTLNGSVYKKSVSRSVYSDSQYAERRANGYATPRPTGGMAHLDVPRAPSRARSTNSIAPNYLEVPPRAPSRARSPTAEVTAVDPTLEDAQKAGNNYHITMSLNAALADAGISGSAASAIMGGRASQMETAGGGRASQMDYATIGSRSQGFDGTAGSRSVSRIDVYGTGIPVPAPRMTQSDHGGVRNGAVSVVQIDGGGRELIGRAATATPLSLVASYSASHRDVISANGGGYTIRSVQPSAARKEIQTTVERTSGGGNNTVGFDLELFGGQTTTIKEETTADTGTSRSSRSGMASLTKSTRDSHGTGGKGGGGGGGSGGGSSSWETSFTRHRTHVSDADRERPARSGKTRKQPKPTVDRGRDTPDFGSVVNDEEDDDEDLNYTTSEFSRNVSVQRPNAGMVGGGTKRGFGPGGRGTRGRVNNYETTEVETVVERQRPVESPRDRRNPWLLQGDDNDEMDESWAIYSQLAKGAGPGTIHQRVYVEKDEDDIVEDGPQIKDMLNVDTVSEKVLVFVGNNIAEMTIKVRTERIVPIKGSNNMFRKSAVTVNRIIEVDMMATYERQRIYENVLDRQRTSGRDLNQKETFDLYKAFLRLAEDDEGEATRDQVQIDKTTDEAQLEELKRASNFYEKRDSFDAGTTSNSLGQSRGFNSTSRSASRLRESRINEYGIDDSEVSSAIY